MGMSLRLLSKNVFRNALGHRWTMISTENTFCVSPSRLSYGSFRQNYYVDNNDNWRIIQTNSFSSTVYTAYVAVMTNANAKCPNSMRYISCYILCTFILV